jgi:putative inorganic carbon (hco3(-)) transporter
MKELTVGIPRGDSDSPARWAMSPLACIPAGLLLSVALLYATTLEIRWPLGLVALVGFMTMFAAATDKTRFLFVSFLLSVTLRTTVNLWVPTAPRFIVGSATTTTAIELFAWDPPLILLFFWVASSAHKNRIRTFRVSDVLAFGFILWAAVSIVGSPDPRLGLARLPVVGRMILIYYCAGRGITSRNRLSTVVATINVCLLLQGGLAIAQTTFGSFVWLGPLVERPDQVSTVVVGAGEFGRATGTIGYTTTFAQYMGMLSPLALSMLLFERSKGTWFFYGAGYALGTIATLLSLSRAEVMNLMIVAAGVVVLAWYKRYLFERRVIRTLVLIAAFALASVMPFRQAIIGRFVLPDEDSAASRIPMARVALRVIQANPLFGVGLHNYTQVMREYGLDRLFSGVEFPVHNTFLYIAAEIGILGLASLLSLWAVTYKRLFGSLRGGDELRWHVAAGVILGLTALFVHSQVEVGFHADQVLAAMLWFYFGLAGALIAMERRGEVQTAGEA